MAELLPSRRNKPQWTRASDYAEPRRRRRRGGGGNGGGRGGGARYRGSWLRAARETGPILWAAPLAVGVAVFLGFPQSGTPTVENDAPPAWAQVTEAELRQRIWPNSPEALEAQQPDMASPDQTVAGARAVGGRGADRESARFAPCAFASREACVVDGDTFWYRGQKIRVADINTPEVSSPKCPAEAALGARATARLTELLNAGAFSLESADRSHDKYGRALFTVTRGGTSVGAALVREGLAEEWRGYRREWC